MELSRPVVVQHQGHLTLTLDLQGQILKMLYLRNGRADWHGTKGIWVDMMLDPRCDFELWPHPWPWPSIFKVKVWKSHNSGMGCPIDMEWKGCESTECWTHVMTFNFDWHGTKGLWVDMMLDPHCDFELWRHPWPRPWIFNIKFWNCCIPGMAGPINMERKGYESIGCYTYLMTLSYDLDLGFSRSNFKNAVSQEWEGRLTWNQRESIGC